MTVVSNGRRQPRMACNYPASCEGARGRVRAECTNLSLGGAFLDGAQLPVGSLTTVTISVPGNPSLTISAQVRHHTISPRGMGVQFFRLEPAQVELLQTLCGSEES